MRSIEFTETSCPRTKAKECSCGKVNAITEAQETTVAQCILEHSDTVKGSILLIQAPGTATLVKGTITGLTPGLHGFHIHEFGDMSDGCKSMGGHYNPDGVDHGDINEGHVGDLGNITADESGTAKFTIEAKRVDLLGERSVIGRGFVVHSDEDDLGKGGDDESMKTGNAGDRLACGVIVTRAEEVAE
jgi:Cu-Zn family superoxide dismutase